MGDGHATNHTKRTSFEGNTLWRFGVHFEVVQFVLGTPLGYLVLLLEALGLSLGLSGNKAAEWNSYILYVCSACKLRPRA